MLQAAGAAGVGKKGPLVSSIRFVIASLQLLGSLCRVTIVTLWARLRRCCYSTLSSFPITLRLANLCTVSQAAHRQNLTTLSLVSAATFWPCAVRAFLLETRIRHKLCFWLCGLAITPPLVNWRCTAKFSQSSLSVGWPATQPVLLNPGSL